MHGISSMVIDGYVVLQVRYQAMRTAVAPDSGPRLMNV